MLQIIRIKQKDVPALEAGVRLGRVKRAQKATAQVALLPLGLMALCLVECVAMKEGQTIYAFKHKLCQLLTAAHGLVYL